MFQPLHRITGPAGPHRPGTGLGLAIRRRIVEALGGTMGFESEEGRGSRFWFTVPAVEVPSANGALTGQSQQASINPDHGASREDLLATILGGLLKLQRGRVALVETRFTDALLGALAPGVHEHDGSRAPRPEPVDSPLAVTANLMLADVPAVSRERAAAGLMGALHMANAQGLSSPRAAGTQSKTAARHRVRCSAMPRVGVPSLRPRAAQCAYIRKTMRSTKLPYGLMRLLYMDADTNKSTGLSQTAVHRTVSALRQAESRYRRLFETARDGILLINSDTAQIEDVNPYLIEMLGYSHDEFLGKKLWEVGLFTDATETQAMFEEVQSRGYARYDDLPLQSKSGNIIPVEFVSNSYDCDGIKVIQCNIREISERKLNEARLRRLTNHLAALSACNKAIVRCTSEASLLQEVCHSAVQFGGMKMAWVGRIDADTHMLLPIARFGALDADSNVDGIAGDATDGLVDGPARQFILSGKPYWCQDLQDDPVSQSCRDLAKGHGVAACAALPLYRSGVVTGAFCLYSTETNAFDESARNLLTEMASDVGFALDNFDRRLLRDLAERRLRAAEGRFRSLVEQAAVGIFIAQEGQITYVNPCLARMVGQDSASTMLGSEPDSWVAEGDRKRVAEQIARLRARDVQAVDMEFDLVRPDRSTLPVAVHVADAVWDDRRAEIGTVSDVSERKRSELASQRSIAKLKAAVLSTVNVAMTIGELRDPYTAGHERRVAALAVAIAAELGHDSAMQEGLDVAGHLHDVGKVMIPSEILTKPGKLSPIEMQLVRGHSQAGYDILKSVEFPWPVAEIVLQHHERLDGGGYPRGLKGNAILREAQILAVADVVEAMSSHRPYRPGHGVTAALAEIERGKGTEYALDVVDGCVRLFREKNYEFPA